MVLGDLLIMKTLTPALDPLEGAVLHQAAQGLPMDAGRHCLLRRQDVALLREGQESISFGGWLHVPNCRTL